MSYVSKKQSVNSNSMSSALEIGKIQYNNSILMGKLSYLQQYMQTLRQSGNGNSGSKDTNSQADDMKIYYQSQMDNVQGEIASNNTRLKKYQSSSSSNSFGDRNQLRASSESMRGYKASSKASSGTQQGGTQKRGFVDTMKQGFQQVGKAVGDFISQIRGQANTNEDSKGNNANCGPTSLAMIARMFGKSSGDASTADSEIEKMRSLMGGSNDEYSTTTASQLVQGAKGLGLNANYSNDMNSLFSTLNNGGKAIVGVVPSKYGGSGNINHFVVVNSIKGDRAELFDPLQQKPITVSTRDLYNAMQATGNNHIVSVTP